MKYLGRLENIDIWEDDNRERFSCSNREENTIRRIRSVGRLRSLVLGQDQSFGSLRIVLQMVFHLSWILPSLSRPKLSAENYGVVMGTLQLACWFPFEFHSMHIFFFVGTLCF